MNDILNDEVVRRNRSVDTRLLEQANRLGRRVFVNTYHVSTGFNISHPLESDMYRTIMKEVSTSKVVAQVK